MGGSGLGRRVVGVLLPLQHPLARCSVRWRFALALSHSLSFDVVPSCCSTRLCRLAFHLLSNDIQTPRQLCARRAGRLEGALACQVALTVRNALSRARRLITRLPGRHRNRRPQMMIAERAPTAAISLPLSCNRLQVRPQSEGSNTLHGATPARSFCNAILLTPPCHSDGPRTPKVPQPYAIGACSTGLDIDSMIVGEGAQDSCHGAMLQIGTRWLALGRACTFFHKGCAEGANALCANRLRGRGAGHSHGHPCGASTRS